MEPVSKNTELLHCVLNDNIATATLHSSLGNDGWRKRLKLDHNLSTHHNPRQRILPDPSSGACAAETKL